MDHWKPAQMNTQGLGIRNRLEFISVLPVGVCILQLDTSYIYDKAVVFGMSNPESGAAPERAAPKNRRHKELSFPSSPRALALTPCSTDTSLMELQKKKLPFGTLKCICSHEKPSHLKPKNLRNRREIFQQTHGKHFSSSLVPVCSLKVNRVSLSLQVSHAQLGSFRQVQTCKCACVEYY